MRYCTASNTTWTTILIKPEQKVWRYGLKPALDKVPRLEYERIELRTGSNGTPDVYISFNGSIWVENKHVVPKNIRGVDTLDLRGWRKGQRSWAKRHMGCGANTWLFLGGKGGYFLAAPELCWDLDILPLDHAAIRGRWMRQVDPRELIDILCSRNT